MFIKLNLNLALWIHREFDPTFIFYHFLWIWAYCQFNVDFEAHYRESRYEKEFFLFQNDLLEIVAPSIQNVWTRHVCWFLTRFGFRWWTSRCRLEPNPESRSHSGDMKKITVRGKMRLLVLTLVSLIIYVWIKYHTSYLKDELAYRSFYSVNLCFHP